METSRKISLQSNFPSVQIYNNIIKNKQVQSRSKRSFHTSEVNFKIYSFTSSQHFIFSENFKKCKLYVSTKCLLFLLIFFISEIYPTFFACRLEIHISVDFISWFCYLITILTQWHNCIKYWILQIFSNLKHHLFVTVV